MGKGMGGLAVVIIIFLIGAWAGMKWPSVNLIGKVTG